MEHNSREPFTGFFLKRVLQTLTTDGIPRKRFIKRIAFGVEKQRYLTIENTFHKR